MSDITAVIGLVDETEADAVVAEMLAHGLRNDEFEVRTPAPGRYRLADEFLHNEARSAVRVSLLGGLIGLALGLGAGVLFTGVGIVTVMVAAGSTSFGLLIGGMIGLTIEDQLDDDPVEFSEVERGSHARLVEVHSIHWRHRAHRVLERHGARFLATGDPVTS